MDDVELRKEVFAWFGGAAYAAQCFEVELTILLLGLHRARNSSLSSADLEDLDAQLSRQNLGCLLKEMKKHLILHPDFESLLHGYREKRNYLTHRFFYENSAKLLSRTGCEQLVVELQAIQGELREADEIMQAMSRKVRGILGIPEGKFQEWVAKELHREGSKQQALMPNQPVAGREGGLCKVYDPDIHPAT